MRGKTVKLLTSFSHLGAHLSRHLLQVRRKMGASRAAYQQPYPFLYDPHVTPTLRFARMLCGMWRF
jgi:hypothetical protein